MLQKLKDKVRTLSGELANVHFSYREPIKNFDRSKVKGVVARLIKIKDRSIILIHVIQYQNYTSHTFSEMLLQNSYNLLCQNFDSGLAECCHHERYPLHSTVINCYFLLASLACDRYCHLTISACSPDELSEVYWSITLFCTHYF